MLDDHETVDLTAQEGVQEGRVVAEGHASVRLAVGAEHVSMRKHPVAAKDLAVVDGNEANRTNAVKKLLARNVRS
jgi:hypothetical protein